MISTTLNALNLSEIHTQIQSRVGCRTERSGRLCHCDAIHRRRVSSPVVKVFLICTCMSCALPASPVMSLPAIHEATAEWQVSTVPVISREVWHLMTSLMPTQFRTPAPQPPRWGFCKVLYKSHQSQIEHQWRQGVKGKHRFLPKVYIFLQGQVSKTSGIQIRNTVSYSEKAQANENWNFLVMLT